MPNRLIREGLMESEAVLSLPVEGRWLFVVVMLSADDLGLFEATEFKLARRADINRDMSGKLLQLMADADLVRFYEVDGKRYGFIPKFRQRIQIKRTKHPMPPMSLMDDDSDALNKINGLGSKTTVVQPLPISCPSAAQPSEPEPEPEQIPNSGISPAAKARTRKRGAVSVKPMATVDQLVEQGFSVEVANEFIEHKRSVKAPLTERAWRDHLAESSKAGWTPQQAAEKVMAKNWKGFEAKYVANERSPGQSQLSFAQQDEAARRARWEETTGRKWPQSRVVNLPTAADFEDIDAHGKIL